MSADKLLAIVVAQQRSGTTVLHRTLSAGSIVHSFEEVFHDKTVYLPQNFFVAKRRFLADDPELHLPTAAHQLAVWQQFASLLRASTAKPVAMIDIKYNSWHHLDHVWHVAGSTPGLVDFVRKGKHPVIHVVRRNLFAQACSEAIASKRSVYHVEPGAENDIARFALQPSALEQRMKQSGELTRRFREYFRSMDRYVELEYESMIEGERLSAATYQTLSNVLPEGLDENQPTALQKVLPRLEEVLTNIDEIVSWFDRTEHGASVRDSLGIASRGAQVIAPRRLFDGVGTISSAEAWSIAQGNPAPRWPKREPGNRLEPLTVPMIQPRFRIPQEATVFTIGSCFARNVEREFLALGCRVPTLAFGVPESEWVGGVRNGILNKYTPAAIFQELERGARRHGRGDADPSGSVGDFPFLELGADRIVDLELGGFIPVTLERAVERRREVDRLFARAFDADVVTITLGLVEAWWDRTRHAFIQQVPSKAMRELAPSRFEFVLMDFEICHRYMTEAIDTLRRIGKPGKRFLLTASPVPLDMTFTREDVIVANMESKSILRAVAGRLARENADVDYFSSYETAIHSKEPGMWESDLRHVNPIFVRKIVNRLGAAYLDMPAVQPTPRRDDDLALSGASIAALNSWCSEQGRVLRLHPDKPGEEAVVATFEVSPFQGRQFTCVVRSLDSRCRPQTLELRLVRAEAKLALFEARIGIDRGTAIAWVESLPDLAEPARLELALKLQPEAADFAYSAIQIEDPRLVLRWTEPAE